MNPADVEGHIVPGPWRRVGTAALAGTVTVLPFAILESVNRRGLPGDFPVALFVFLWLLAFSFPLILMPVVRGLAARRRKPGAGVVLGAVLLIFIGWLWVRITADQMPCFLGVPKCD